MVIWETVNDGEYNERRLREPNNIGDFSFYSDREGNVWTLQYPDESTNTLESTTLPDAVKEIHKIIEDYAKAQREAVGKSEGGKTYPFLP